jgi:2-isopropylmalate synthase
VGITRSNRETILKRAVDAVAYAKSLCARHPNAKVEFSPMDASRTEPGYLYEVIEATIDAGATIINIPDTVGYAEPFEFGGLIKSIKENVPHIGRAIISVHCHNDLGLAVANSLAAVQHGARQVECTINGIGERAGNASMEEIVMGLRVRADVFGAKTSINTKEIYKASRLVSKLTGFVIAPNKAIVGLNAFRHESGIHQDGVLKKRATYEIIHAEDVGFKVEGLVLGKHSGRHAFKERLKKIGYRLSDAGVDTAFIKFKALADKKKQVFDDDLAAIIQEDIESNVAEVWRLESFVITSGSHINPTARIKLASKGESFENTVSGDGPVDACYKAIEKITHLRCQLLDYSLQSVTRGEDAQGEVSVRLKAKSRETTGRASSTDIIEASIKAYLQAVNKIAIEK